MKKENAAIGILVIITGLMMIFSPEGLLKTLVIFIGIAAVIYGLYLLFLVRRERAVNGFPRLFLVRGIISIASGVLAVSLPLILAGALWIVMLYVLAAYLLVSAGIEIYRIISLRNNGITAPYSYGELIVTILLAVILLVMPAKIGFLIIRIAGFLLLAGAAVYLIIEWKKKPLIVEPDSTENLD